MTFAEYKQRKDKLTAAIVQWMTTKNPDTDTFDRVTRHMSNTLQIWWNQIEDDGAVLIVNKLMK
jgi:hypothetical protein